MLPMLLLQAESGVKRQIWSTLALSTVGGLATSTLLLLVVIPVFYIYGDRLKSWTARKVAEIGQSGK
jgi:HAE1 family hydrophobic/amphiphilic exporter-1